MSFGQIVYTSSRYSLNAPHLNLHNQLGFNVYSCSKSLTKEELQDFLKYKEYEVPKWLVTEIPFPLIEFSPDVPGLFPSSFSYFRLCSGKYAIMRSCFSGVEYSGRRGNTFSHVLIFDELPQAFNPTGYIHSPSFRCCLSQTEVSEQNVGFLDSLNDIEFENTPPQCNEKDTKWALNVLADAYVKDSLIILDADFSEITAFLKVIFALVPSAFTRDLFFTTYAPTILPINNERRGIYRIAGTGKPYSNLNIPEACKHGYAVYEAGCEVKDSFLYELLTYAKINGIKEKVFTEMGIDTAKKLILLAGVQNKLLTRETPEEFGTLTASMNAEKAGLIILYLADLYHRCTKLLEVYHDFWNIINQKVDFNSLPKDVKIDCFQLLVDSILSGACYSTDEIMKLQDGATYGSIAEYCISPSFLRKLDIQLEAGSLHFSQLEQILLIFLICRKHNMKLCQNFDKNITFILAFHKYIEYVEYGSIPESTSVLLHSTIFLNSDNADKIFEQLLFEKFSAQTLSFSYKLVDVNIRKYIVEHIINTMLIKLSSSDKTTGWTYVNNKENIIGLIGNIKYIEADDDFEDILTAITLFYEYICNGSAGSSSKANKALRMLEHSCRSHFDVIVPKMILTVLQLPVKNQDKFYEGLKFNSIMWSGYMSSIQMLFCDAKLNSSVVVNHISFFQQFQTQITNSGAKNKIESFINKKLCEISENWHNWGLILKIALVLKLKHGVWIDIKKKGLS